MLTKLYDYVNFLYDFVFLGQTVVCIHEIPVDHLKMFFLW